MVSTCPSCKKQLEHEDYLFEVECSCGVRFNPFFDPSKNLSEDFSVSESAPTPPAEPPPETFEFSEPAPETPTNDFSESAAAFQDIVQFGEALADPESPNPPTSVTPSAPAVGIESTSSFSPESPVRTASNPMPGECWITTSERLEGYVVDAYLIPLSAVIALNTADREPLKKGFESLRQQSLEAGGNGVIGVKWGFTPDGTHVLMTGNSVRCRKQ